ncbi:MAG: hypothetical protein IPJ14_09620 [Kineosporiaceae bacterium]|nr:hypothetical protein [Kineosporiaceae bacterium]
MVAARLATRLKDDLRLDNVFLDRMDILAGWPWRAVLARRLRSSDAVLVLVGDRWGGGPDGDGSSRPTTWCGGSCAGRWSWGASWFRPWWTARACRRVCRLSWGRCPR